MGTDRGYIKFEDGSKVEFEEDIDVISKNLLEKMAATVGHERAEIIEVCIPDSVETIDELAFSRCAVNKVRLDRESSRLRYIRSKAFFDVSELQEFEFPRELQHIGAQAFCYGGLRKLNLPHTQVGYIEAGAFCGCIGLVSADLGEVHFIDNSAFENCENLKSVLCEEDIFVYSYAFAECGNLKLFDAPSVNYLEEGNEALARVLGEQ